MCFGAAQQSAVGSVRFACSSGEGVAAKIIEEKNQTVLIVPPPYGDFEDLLAAMQVEYGLRTYGGAWTDKQTWRTQNRFAFLAGEALYRSDLLEQLREQRLEAKVMVERLAAGIERVRSLYQV